MEDVHAGLCTAHHLIVSLGGLGKVKVGAVRFPGKTGTGPSAPDHPGLALGAGPPLLGGLSFSSPLPPLLPLPASPGLGHCRCVAPHEFCSLHLSWRRHWTLHPQEKGHAPHLARVRPGGLRKYSQGTPEMLERGPFVSGGGLRHLFRTRPGGLLTLQGGKDSGCFGRARLRPPSVSPGLARADTTSHPPRHPPFSQAGPHRAEGQAVPWAAGASQSCHLWGADSSTHVRGCRRALWELKFEVLAVPGSQQTPKQVWPLLL